MRAMLEQYRWMWNSVDRWYPGGTATRTAVFLWFVVRDLGGVTSQRVVTTCAIVLAGFVLATSMAQRDSVRAGGGTWTLPDAVASVSVPWETSARDVNRMAYDLMSVGVRRVEFTMISTTSAPR